MKIHIIGCGGAGSWLAASLCPLSGKRNVVLIDGDTLERRNLNRQLFNETMIGQNKAEALATRYGCESMPVWFHAGTLELSRSDWLMVCADNNRARNAALTAADIQGARVIVCANEKHSAEAYYYQPSWKDTLLDPRRYYPEITTDQTGDPMAASIGCTGEAQEESPQLVTANALAAALAGHLFVLWAMKAPKLDAETITSLPYLLRANMTRLEQEIVGDGQPQLAR